MDIVPSQPRSPVTQPRSTGNEEPSTILVQELTTLTSTLSHAALTKVLPGNLPAIEIAPDDLLATAAFLRDRLQFDLLSCISGVDMIDHCEVVYHLRSLPRNLLMQMKVKLPPGVTEIESLISIWITANWLERETFDMYGIRFSGHPDLRRILLDDEFEGYPLRKDFRPSPLTVHDRATTQTDPERALSGAQERGLGPTRAVPNVLSQGDQERLHPGTPTFGHTQFHGKEFPPQTWKHTLERAHEADTDEKKK